MVIYCKLYNIYYIVNVSKIEQFYASSNSLKTASDAELKATSIWFGPEMKRKNLCYKKPEFNNYNIYN